MYVTIEWLTMTTNKISDPTDWISQSEAARLRGVTRQAIHRLVNRGKLRTYEIGGMRLVLREEVAAYTAAEPGRPATIRDAE